MTDLERTVEAHVLDDHRDAIRSLSDCADRVAEGWGEAGRNDADSTHDSAEIVRSLSRELRESGLMARFPDLLADAVNVAGFSLQARPVPAPPYMAVTSRGPVLRATLPDGRLVVSFLLFDVVRTERGRDEKRPVRYVRGARTPEEIVRVELR